MTDNIHDMQKIRHDYDYLFTQHAIFLYKRWNHYIVEIHMTKVYIQINLFCEKLNSEAALPNETVF